MTVPPDATGPVPVLDTPFFRRWLDRATALIGEQAGYLTDLDSAIGDADHGSNMRRGFGSASAAEAYAAAATPGALLKAFGTHLTNTVGGASGPLYGTVLRRAARALGQDAATVSPEALGEALAAAVAGVRKLGDSAPGDKTMVDALAPAAEAYAAALGAGAGLRAALAAAAGAAREGAAATVPMRARRGRASYLGERSVGHQDPGATSSALLITALYEAADPEAVPTAAPEAASGASEPAPEAAAEAPGEPGGGTGIGEPAAPAAGPAATADAGSGAAAGAGPGPRVGMVLVSHSREVAEATAGLARALVGAGSPAPVAAAGGVEDGGIGTSAVLVRRACEQVDEGRGIVVLCDMGSAVLTVKALLAASGADALPGDVRLVDAPFVEGAVAALVTASAGAGLDLVLSAADDARTYRKL